MEVRGNNSDKVTTEGDVFIISDNVMFIYTFVCYSGLCQAFNIFGIATNIINIFCFGKQGFHDSVNISLLGLAVSDLGSLTTMAFSCIFITPTVVLADLPFDPVDVIYLTSAMLHVSFTRVSGCLTALITAERCLCITAPLQIKTIVTPKRTAFIVVCVFIIFFFSGVPVYAVNRLGIKFFPSRNKTLVGLISTEDREQVEKITFTINNFLVPFATFVIIIVCTTILSIKLSRAIKWRQKTIISSQVDRASVRNQKAAKMVVMISTLFIVCFIPVCVLLLLVGFVPEMSITGKYIRISIVFSGIGYVLEGVNSSVNIFIYYNMSSKYREVCSKYLGIDCWNNSQSTSKVITCY